MRGRRAGLGPWSHGLKQKGAWCAHRQKWRLPPPSPQHPPRSGRQALGSLGSGGGFLARSGDALIKPRVHFPAQLSPARYASQE